MAFTVTVDLPAEVEKELLASTPNLDATAKEALLVALYRQGKLSLLKLSESLGLDRFETKNVLFRHNVVEDLGTPEEYMQDARKLADLLGKSR